MPLYDSVLFHSYHISTIPLCLHSSMSVAGALLLRDNLECKLACQ